MIFGHRVGHQGLGTQRGRLALGGLQLSIQGCRCLSQSSMSSIWLPETGPRPSRTPRLLSAVSGDSPRAVASLEAGKAEQGCDMAMGQRPLEGDGLVEGSEDDAALEEGADDIDDGWGLSRRLRAPIQAGRCSYWINIWGPRYL